MRRRHPHGKVNESPLLIHLLTDAFQNTQVYNRSNSMTSHSIDQIKAGRCRRIKSQYNRVFRRRENQYFKHGGRAKDEGQSSEAQRGSDEQMA